MHTMITLTYPGEYPDDGRLVKQHWSAMRRWFAHRNLGGIWWLEFQQRGAAHIHVYLNGEVSKSDVSAAWYRIVGSGDERHLKAGTRVEIIRDHSKATAYATKYAHKIEQKSVPASYQKVGRFWGLFGGVKVEAEAVLEGFQEKDGERGTTNADELTRQLVRFVRRAVHHDRKGWAIKRGRRDNGKCSWVGWDVGWMVRDYLERLGHLVRQIPADHRIRRGVPLPG